MCSRGVTGLDDLHSATNEFLGHFVDVVYESKGDGKISLSSFFFYLFIYLLLYLFLYSFIHLFIY